MNSFKESYKVLILSCKDKNRLVRGSGFLYQSRMSIRFRCNHNYLADIRLSCGALLGCVAAMETAQQQI